MWLVVFVFWHDRWLSESWNVWGFHELGLFQRVHRSKNYDRKKVTVIWPLVAMSDCFGRFLAIFFGGFLNQITNYNRKKRYSRLGRPDDCTFFSGRNLNEEGRNPPKNIAHNFHFSKYEIWWHLRTLDCFGGSTKHKTQHTQTQQPTRWAVPPYPPVALPPLSLWVEQWPHQIMVLLLPNAMPRPRAVGVALAVVGLLAWGGKIRGTE